MNKIEAYKILTVMQLSYADTAKNYSDMALDGLVSLWTKMFEDTPAEIVEMAVMAYMANDVTGRFMPTPGAIRNEVAKLMPSGGETLSEAEAWGMVYTAIRNSAYNAKEEYEKLPPAVQRAVGRWDILHEWAISPKVNMDVVSSNFMRSFREAREEEKRLAKMPPMVRERMAALAASSVSALPGDAAAERKGQIQTGEKTKP